MDKKQPSILAIAPGTRHLGFAAFDGTELVRFGVRSLRGRKTRMRLHSQAMAFLDSLSERQHPTMLAIEDVFYIQARSCPALHSLILAIRHWGKARKIKVIGHLPTTVKEHFCSGRKTRPALAEAMVVRYRFLHAYLKPEKKTRHYWQQMFDAVALGALVCEEHLRPQRRLGQARRRQDLLALDPSRAA
jgi:Holliday junction resolvasome RuvABC endonuclease subunit